MQRLSEAAVFVDFVYGLDTECVNERFNVGSAGVLARIAGSRRGNNE